MLAGIGFKTFHNAVMRLERLNECGTAKRRYSEHGRVKTGYAAGKGKVRGEEHSTITPVLWRMRHERTSERSDCLSLRNTVGSDDHLTS